MAVSNPAISVVISVYNVEKYLRECLDSVRCQTFGDFEAILVDDGSVDLSGVICDEYAQKDSRFQVIHQKNSGLSLARNRGMEASTGTYLYFLDSDDRIDETTFAALIQKMHADGSDFVFFDGRSFADGEKGCRVNQGYTRAREYAKGSGLCVFDALQQHREFKSSVPLCLWKRDFLLNAQLRFFSGILYEDMLFTFEAFCKAGSVSHCHSELYRRRIRQGSIMTSKPNEKNFLSACTVYRKVVRIARENGCYDRSSVKQYIVRCAFRPIEIFSDLSFDDRRKCRTEYVRVIQEIRAAKGYESRALFFRTYSKLLWAICRIYEKIHGEK